MKGLKLLLILSLVNVGPATAQTVVGDAAACNLCSIVTRRVATLGTADGPAALPGAPHAATIDSRQRIWLLFPSSPPFVFGSDATLIGEVGRLGGGPGEFRSPWRIRAAGDSVVVFDQTGFATVYGPDLQHVRTTAGEGVHAPVDVAVLSWPAAVVVAAAIPQPDAAGWPLHLVDFRASRASVLSSFGATDGVLPPPPNRDQLIQGYLPQAERMQELIAVGPARSFFTVSRRTEYVIRKWAAPGTLSGEMRRSAAWFPEQATWTLGGMNTPPDPRMAAVWYDGSGLLWVYAHVASPDWAQRRREHAAAAGSPGRNPVIGSTRSSPVRTVLSQLYLYDTMIEILDVEQMVVIVRARFSGYVTGVLPDGRFLAYRETAEGVNVVDVHTASLRGR
jgi:hypothetical protein